MKPCEWCGADLSVGRGLHATSFSRKLGRHLCFDIDLEDDGRWVARSRNVHDVVAHGTCEPDAVWNGRVAVEARASTVREGA